MLYLFVFKNNIIFNYITEHYLFFIIIIVHVMQHDVKYQKKIPYIAALTSLLYAFIGMN